MATKRKDVELALRVSTPGAESVGELGSDLQGLASESRKVGAASEAGAAGLLALRDAERAAREELQAAQRTLQQRRDAIRLLRLETDAAAKNSADYRGKIKALQLAQFNAERQVRSLSGAYQQARGATRAAAAAERQLADQVRRTADAQASASKGLGGDLKGIAGQLTQIRAAAAALLGGQLVGGMLGDVARTADEFANLAGRVKLATGEGKAFETAFSGVFDVAQRTNTAVEATGTLFTRIAQAGKTLGVGVSDALALTETINQSVQVSGSSAEASNAAITQLIQGLQSGVLRGEEFNSVMEQAPRLAQALADGLGVTTGELRKLAQAGKLTSETVIRALQGQAAVVQSEFERLPATVGRAITNLSTAWTQYVGEVDKAHGVSAAAAGVINTLARNLDTVGTLLYSAGKAAAAYKAVQLAQTLLTHAQATTVATAATTANTAATVANTAAKRQNAAATAAAGDAATAGAGRFAGAIASIKLSALALVLTNFREIGTAIGEGTAKLFGYGKQIERLEQAEKVAAAAAREQAAAKAALAQQLQIASDKALGLTAESKKLVDEFEGVRLKGESAAAALEKLTKNLRIGDIKGIADAGAALDALGIKGELAASQVRDAWTQALKGVDLGVFSAQAQAAFDGSEQGARRLAAALDGATREAIRRTGLDFALLSGGMGAAARSAINDLELIVSQLDTLEAAGVDTGRALTASLSKGIDSADSQQAVDSLTARIESLRAKLGDRVTDGFLDQAAARARELADAVDAAQPGVQSLREAYRQLGVQAPEDLARIAAANKAAWETIRRDGTADTDLLKAAFARYAASALDAAGAIGSGNRAATQELLKTEAAAKGLAVQFDASGRMIVRGANESAKAVDGLGEAFDRSTRSIERQSAALDELYNRNRVGGDPTKTPDGFQRGPDGAGAGTFNNMLPTDLAHRLMRTNGQGMTREEVMAAIAQAEAIGQDRDSFARQNPGGMSMEYQQSVNALLRAAGMARERTAPAPTGERRAGGTRTVRIDLNGSKTDIGVASPEDSDLLVGFLRELEAAKRSAA